MSNKKTRKLWTRDFTLIIVINFLVFMNHIMILNTFPMFLETLGMDEGVAGGCAFAFSAVAVVLRPFIGWLLNNGRRKSILIIGITGMFLMPLGYMTSGIMAGMGYAAVSAVVLAIVCRMLQGAALAFSNTTTATIASDALPQSRFAEGMGYFGMATALATSIAPALSLKLMSVSFSLMFIVSSAFMVVAFMLYLFMNTSAKKPEAPVSLTLRGLIDSDAVPASVICLVFLLTWGALENFLSKFAAENNLPSGGTFFLITAVMLIVVRFTLGSLADKMGEGIFVYSCNAAMLIAFLLLAVAPCRTTFYIAAILAGYAFGGIEPALQSMAVHIAPPERRGSANSTFLCAYDIGLGGGGGIAGVLISRLGYSKMFLIVAMATVASILLYFFWGSRHPSSLKYKRG
ncbi:Predicted arabinose efflux permease, MFS family [Butyrivibrio fibrisolvens]|uniref:Predicted arabinose efflux permease, MFS family n=1 Tax=Butyrivibrio fibrisolvens TaxID=831 RepID=A0A1H9VFA1_BUTFI|nr:MFS transporter [Butyrivibrio fibrisolvens]SES20456.1 Predicted arabinose efflux permease, MFS family [Butyrivibrio fibrisolvens]